MFYKPFHFCKTISAAAYGDEGIPPEVCKLLLCNRKVIQSCHKPCRTRERCFLTCSSTLESTTPTSCTFTMPTEPSCKTSTKLTTHRRIKSPFLHLHRTQIDNLCGAVRTSEQALVNSYNIVLALLAFVSETYGCELPYIEKFIAVKIFRYYPRWPKLNALYRLLLPPRQVAKIKCTKI